MQEVCLSHGPSTRCVNPREICPTSLFRILDKNNNMKEARTFETGVTSYPLTTVLKYDHIFSRRNYSFLNVNIFVQCKMTAMETWGVFSVLNFIAITNISRDIFIQYSFVIIIIMYLSWSWATCWPVPVSRISKFCNDCFCQWDSSVSLPWVIYF